MSGADKINPQENHEFDKEYADLIYKALSKAAESSGKPDKLSPKEAREFQDKFLPEALGFKGNKMAIENDPESMTALSKKLHSVSFFNSFTPKDLGKLYEALKPNEGQMPQSVGIRIFYADNPKDPDQNHFRSVEVMLITEMIDD